MFGKILHKDIPILMAEDPDSLTDCSISRREVRGAAQRRTPDQERLGRGRLQDLQVPDQAPTDRGDEAVRHSRSAGDHR